MNPFHRACYRAPRFFARLMRRITQSTLPAIVGDPHVFPKNWWLALNPTPELLACASECCLESYCGSDGKALCAAIKALLHGKGAKQVNALCGCDHVKVKREPQDLGGAMRGFGSYALGMCPVVSHQHNAVTRGTRCHPRSVAMHLQIPDRWTTRCEMRSWSGWLQCSPRPLRV